MKYGIFISLLCFSIASMASEHSDSESERNLEKRTFHSSELLAEAEVHAAAILQRLHGVRVAAILQQQTQIQTPSVKRRLTFDKEKLAPVIRLEK
jgi:hypothetical protein